MIDESVPGGDDGTTFLSALHSKYCDDDGRSLEQLDFGNRKCQFVGFDRVLQNLKNVTNLRVINLSAMKISTHDNVDDRDFMLRQLASLDLSHNRIESWLTVAKIVQLAKPLLELVLSSNPLKSPTDKEIGDIGSTLANLKVIILGDMSYTWADVQRCVSLWPNVERLNLFKNRIAELNMPHCDFLANLKSLSLSTNPISDWREICKLAKLQKYIRSVENC